jgi:hypothetical protein
MEFVFSIKISAAEQNLMTCEQTGNGQTPGVKHIMEDVSEEAAELHGSGVMG